MLPGHLRLLVLWEAGRSFILTQGGMFDFRRGGQRLWSPHIIRGGT